MNINIPGHLRKASIVTHVDPAFASSELGFALIMLRARISKDLFRNSASLFFLPPPGSGSSQVGDASAGKDEG